MRPRPLIALFLLAAALFGARAALAEAAIEARDAWAPPSTAADVGVAYLTLSNHGDDDAVTGGSTPAAKAVELHEMRMQGSVMSMHRLDKVDLPSGQSVEFDPDALHIMLIGLAKPLKDGDTVALTLRFAHAAPITVSVPVSAARLQDSLKSPRGMSM